MCRALATSGLLLALLTAGAWLGSGLAAPVGQGGPDPVLVGAGDIADCAAWQDDATAVLLDGIAGTVVTLGDNAYENGTAAEFAACYEPTWGRHKARTGPSPGNHDYHSAGAVPYFAYFGANAGPPGAGYYSYDLGVWHVVSLNSEAPAGAGSAQEQWLRADLTANPRACTLAYWHRPRFSSGPHGSDASMQALWQALYDHGADVVLSGHDHTYERFAPQTPSGAFDGARGIRQFVVGTGGRALYAFGTIRPNSEVRRNDTHGVLKLTLRSTSYEWEFVPIAGQTFRDTGVASCVSAPPTTGPPTASPNPTATRAPTSTATRTASSTPTPFPTPTPPGAACTPHVAVTAAPAGDGRLRVTIAAAPGANLPVNQVQAIEFIALDNASVEIPAQPGVATAVLVTSPRTVSGELLPKPVSLIVYVSRVVMQRATTVRAVVRDGCGAWPTFVGGGAAAF